MEVRYFLGHDFEFSSDCNGKHVGVTFDWNAAPVVLHIQLGVNLNGRRRQSLFVLTILPDLVTDRNPHLDSCDASKIKCFLMIDQICPLVPAQSFDCYRFSWRSRQRTAVVVLKS
eukprot:scaffold12421_cov131-Cylindrotheca_fusiformis.AAC.1